MNNTKQNKNSVLSSNDSIYKRNKLKSPNDCKLKSSNDFKLKDKLEKLLIYDAAGDPVVPRMFIVPKMCIK